MVTIAQASEARPGERPDGHAVLKTMKGFLGKDAASHGPLPKDSPNFAVFAAPGDVVGVQIRIGDAAEPTPIGSFAPSIWSYNRARHPEDFALDDRRFWSSVGPKRAAKAKGA